MVYRLELATMPFAVWNGDRFVGPRERFHLRLLETATRAEGGWVERVGGPLTGVLLVPEIATEHCLTCDWDVSPGCKPRSHVIADDAMVINRDLLAAIDDATAPWLEAEADANAAADADAIMTRAFRWEASHGYGYVPSHLETVTLRRRLAQLDHDSPLHQAILARFPKLLLELVVTDGETTPVKDS